MKIIIAYSLLLFYAVALLKPVLPPLTDWIQHTFTLEHHLATVHHHHGHSHVEKQMAEEADHHESEKKAPAVFAEPVSPHVTQQSVHAFNAQLLQPVIEYPIIIESLHFSYTFTDAPPPWNAFA